MGCRVAIEFLCDQCKKRLRVPDESAGKKAKCPQCESVQDIPASSNVQPVAPPTAAPAPGSAPVESNPFRPSADSPSTNPYASPNIPQATPQPMGPVGSGTLDARFAAKTAWELFKANIGIMLGVVVIQMVVSVGMSTMGNMLQLAVISATKDPESPVALATQIGLGIFNQCVNTFFSIGLAILCLRACRNQPLDLAQLFSGGKYLLRVIGASILYGLMIVLGFVLLIIPSIYLAIKYQPYWYFIVDRDCSVLESFKLAGNATTGNMGQVFVMWIFSVLMAILGVLALCIGVIPAAAIINLMFVVGYLVMIGQPIMRPTKAAV